MFPSEQETKKLSAAAAQALFIKNYPLKYNVTAKFDDDPITAAPNLSKSTSIADALERYKQPTDLAEQLDSNIQRYA